MIFSIRKKFSLGASLLVLFCMGEVPSFAQWTTSSPLVYLTTTTNNVAIGATSISTGTKLEITGNGTSGTPVTIKNNTSSVLSVYAANATAGTLASFQAYRARGTVASPAAVLAGDRIGGFYGSAYVNSGYQSSAAMEMYVGASPGAGSYPAYILFGTTPTSGTVRQERMRITESGNVGINTMTPGARLEVNGITRITTGNNNYLAVGAYNISTDNFAYFSSGGQSNGTGIKFETTNGSGVNTGAVRMTITNDGTVGIATITPNAAYKLDVNGAINATSLNVNGTPVSGSQWTTNGSNIYFNTVGSVGIGTATPSASYKLDVNGAVNATSLYVNGQPFTGSSQWTTSGSNAYFGLTGNVGIGSTNPDAKLTVNGTVHAKEVRVDLSVPGPDYVFEKEYKLMSLEDVKAYIDKHNHLPDVPSAAEMEENGISVSEMNMILLRKVEELTLHLIDQERRLRNQEKQKQLLMEELSVLKAKH